MDEGTKQKKVKREFSAGGVVYKKIKNQKSNIRYLWLVTKSNPSKTFPESVWRLPKGWLDDEDGLKGPMASGKIKASEDKIRKAALKEVSEEGGVEAKIIKKIGTEEYYYKFGKEKFLKFVTFYLIEWKKDLLDGPGFETSEVAWLPYQEARRKLKYSGEKKILDKAKDILGSKD